MLANEVHQAPTSTEKIASFAILATTFAALCDLLAGFLGQTWQNIRTNSAQDHTTRIMESPDTVATTPFVERLTVSGRQRHGHVTESASHSG